MGVKQYLKNIVVLVWVFFQKKQPKRIFIISHMRSGSSLLTHILNSNPEILGWGERGLRYTSEKKVIENELAMKWKSRAFFKKYKFTLDQINHLEMTPKLELFNNKNTQIIFLLREPISSLSSIINLSKKHYDGTKTIEQAATYYTNRLNDLINFKKSTPKAYHFMLTYNDLVEDSLNKLKSLSEFLELKEPLSPKYKIEKFTGISGDPSKNIKSGRIIKTEKELMVIDQKVISETLQNFNKTIQFLSKK